MKIVLFDNDERFLVSCNCARFSYCSQMQVQAGVTVAGFAFRSKLRNGYRIRVWVRFFMILSVPSSMNSKGLRSCKFLILIYTYLSIRTYISLSLRFSLSVCLPHYLFVCLCCLSVCLPKAWRPCQRAWRSRQGYGGHAKGMYTVSRAWRPYQRHIKLSRGMQTMSIAYKLC